MKVLFISHFELPDFQSDMVFHGLRTLLGEDCVDYNHAWYMYDEDKQRHWVDRVPNGGKSYGGGFTLYGTLQNLSVDKTDIEQKIRTKYFDKIVYGSVHRNLDLIEPVLLTYPANDVIFIDGEDQTHLYSNVFNKGIYFKRELVYSQSEVLRPLNFAIPKELVVNSVPEKTQDWATIIPGDPSTYIFNNQTDYYEDYKKSYFGLTFKKGGWDCLRHYEILMNGCIPYFPKLEDCPENTMVKFPKQLIHRTNKFIDSAEFSVDEYQSIMNDLLVYTRAHLTTTALAEYILSEAS